MDEEKLEYLDNMRDQLTGIHSALEDLRIEVMQVNLNADDNTEVEGLLSSILAELKKITESR